MKVLDEGYVIPIESWGSEERIIEAARMSTGKGFQGWGGRCQECDGLGEVSDGCAGMTTCPVCQGNKVLPSRDEKLLSYLYNNHHDTPFEMAGLIIEVKAPIFVFREWHRHRTQSYNEMSARYIPLPDENYCPTIERIVQGAAANKNKQASGVVPLDESKIHEWLETLQASYDQAQLAYELGLAIGIPKELARLPVPVARYSRMRASANLRNWLGFLTLRDHSGAQWEIRQYAIQVAAIIAEKFPRTYELYERKNHGTNK